MFNVYRAPRFSFASVRIIRHVRFQGGDGADLERRDGS
jgi:hypothetical protein